MHDVGNLVRELISKGKITDPGKPRGRILAVAAKQFCENGYNATTVRNLAAEVGILSGSIFHHFKNKEEILFCVMQEVVLAMEYVLSKSVPESGTVTERLRSLIATELLFIHGTTHNASSVLVSEWRQLTPEHQSLVLVNRKAYDSLWLDVLTQAKHEQLIVSDPKMLQKLLHGAIAWSKYWYQPGGVITIEELIEQVLNLAVKESWHE